MGQFHSASLNASIVVVAGGRKVESVILEDGTETRRWDILCAQREAINESAVLRNTGAEIIVKYICCSRMDISISRFSFFWVFDIVKSRF